MKLPGLVCLDNHILVWGVRQAATPSQEHMIARTRAFLDQLDEEQTRILVPTVVLGEYLTAIDPAYHPDVIRVFTARYQVAPYDVAAAARAASLIQSRLAVRGETVVGADGAEYELSKRKITCDCQIIATAVTRHATIIYTHDGGLAKLAEGVIRTEPIPENLVYQPRLDLDQ